MIFVQISSYRDEQLPATLDSLFDEASHPDKLRVCICWQHSATEKLPARFRRLPNVEIIDVDHRLSRGANWARRLVQKRWRGEPYSLIIDSHLRFSANWDRKLIKLLQGLKAKNIERPVLTCYPPNFSPDTFPKKRSWAPLKNYTERYHSGLLCHFAGFALPFWSRLTEPIPAQFLQCVSSAIEEGMGGRRREPDGLSKTSSGAIQSGSHFSFDRWQTSAGLI